MIDQKTFFRIAIGLLSLFSSFSLFAAADLRLDGGEQGWDVNRWYVQVDGVMGGRSSGKLDFEDDQKTMVFSGDIVTRGGGFSSIRKRSFSSINLTPYAGIVIDVVADTLSSESSTSTRSQDVNEKNFPIGLHLELDDSSQRWDFSGPFVIPLSSESELETSVFIPLEDFNRGNRGPFSCRGCEFSERINGMSIYMLFQEGDFNVRIKSITAVEEAVSFASPEVIFDSVDQVNNIIKNNLDSGDKLYKEYGYVEIYYSKLWSLLGTLLQTPSSAIISSQIKGVICAGLLQATTVEDLDSSNNKREVVEILQDTIEAVYSDLGANVERPEEDWLPVGDDALTYTDQCIGTTSISMDPSLFSGDSITTEETIATTAPTVPVDSAAPVGTLCFPGNAKVVEATKGSISLKDLKIGDSVLDSNGEFSKVYSFGHKDENTEDITYLEFNFEEEDSMPLHISSNHFIFVSENKNTLSSKAVKAGDINVGDYVMTQVGEVTKRVMVSEITETLHNGAYAPFTESGSVVVNDVSVSSYAMIEGYSNSYSHWLAHKMVAPRRLYCRMGMDKCKLEEYNSEGVATWIPFELTTGLMKLVM